MEDLHSSLFFHILPVHKLDTMNIFEHFPLQEDMTCVVVSHEKLCPRVFQLRRFEHNLVFDANRTGTGNLCLTMFDPYQN